MSLTAEKIQIEAKILSIKHDLNTAQVIADMAILNIRQQTSTLIDAADIDMAKIEVAVSQLGTAIGCIVNANKEIKRLEKML